jgi:methyl-accepting chemotaxis protein-2 (aspartate sensor receptor)
MAASSANNRSVARRVTLMALCLVALVLVGVGATLAVLTERSTRAQLVQSVGTTAQAVAQSLDAADNTNREMVRATMRGFQRYFEATMQLDEGAGELRSYGALVNGDYGSVDKFAQETGGVASVYARKGDDFVRITTSVKNAQGERELDTPLARTDPAYAAVLKGEPFTGLVMVQGKPYMGHYLPVKDASGKIVALLFIGNDVSIFHTMLQKQVEQTRFFEHGGVYVINPGVSLEQARFVYHPAARGRGVLEAFPQAKPFLESLAAAEDGFVRHAAPVLYADADDPWALMRKTQGGWWVVAEVPDAEAMAGQRHITWAVWGLPRREPAAHRAHAGHHPRGARRPHPELPHHAAR